MFHQTLFFEICCIFILFIELLNSVCTHVEYHYYIDNVIILVIKMILNTHQ
jgi:hypothetical protein